MEHHEEMSFLDGQLTAIRELRLRGTVGNFIGGLGFIDIAKNVFSSEPDLVQISKGGLKILAAVAISSTGK